jgi:hypothetical protein
MEMKKTDFILKIQTPPADWGIEGKFEISAWGDSLQLDEHLTEVFPELEEELELGDLQEGSMEYWGELSKEALSDKLQSMGFKTELI